MVVHTGDIVDDANHTSEWSAANTSMSILLNNNVPYCWCAGNHDQLPEDADSDPNLDWLGSQYAAFNQTVMEKKSYWVSDICDGKDTAVHFTVNNLDFLVIDIECYANSTVLDWVNGLLNEYPNDYTILATHSYIYHSLEYDETWATTLKSTVLAKHSNVFMTLNGHDPGDSGAHTTVGNINELMFDRQSEEYPDGAATVIILTFGIANNQIEVKTYDLNTGQFMTGPNDQFTLTTTFPSTHIHDVAVTNTASSKSVVCLGYSLNVTVTVADLGNYHETFNVTVYANTTLFASQNVTLSNGDSTTITFPWNTSGFPLGNYTISAYAQPVPDETDIADNNFTYGHVTVTITGDVNADGKVDIKDVYRVALAYGTSLEGPNPPDRTYIPNCDINGDNKIDIKDYYSVCRHYGEEGS